MLAVTLLLPRCNLALAQDSDATKNSGSNEIKTGHWLSVVADLGAVSEGSQTSQADRLISQLTRLANATRTGTRTTVLLRMSAAEPGVAATKFEDALKVARAIQHDELRSLRVITYIECELVGHRQLIALASEQLLVSAGGALGSVNDSSGSFDEPVILTYQAIARRRGLVPPAVIDSMLDLGAELVQVTRVDGQRSILSGDELRTPHAAGGVLSEDVWKQSGAPLELRAKQLRDIRSVVGVVDTLEEASDVLDVAQLIPVDTTTALDIPRGVLVEIKGAIAEGRARRWHSNLVSSLDSGEVNTWLVEIDSSGGSLDTSAGLAASFALHQPPLQTAAATIIGEARGDAALVAIACRPLLMKTDARLGGPGSQAIAKLDVAQHRELIDEIAQSTRRPAALIRGLLDPTLEVYRFTDRKTGRIRFATVDEIAENDAGENEAVQNEEELQRWHRGERIELAGGLTTTDAISLGLAEAEVDSLESAARYVGLDAIPPTIADRPLVRFVERIGRNNGLMFILLMIGFFALSAEAGAPGLGIPGFISMLCFALYFWMKFLAGTAEWLELIALGLGLTCIAIEIFVVPGVGIFGIGGLILTVLGIVLMSQTFVIPRNSYQLEVLTQGIWLALGGVAGLIGGFFVIRTMVPHVPILSDMVMETTDPETLDRHERLSDYSHLVGVAGIATTLLRPAGKARFGDTIVAVISDGRAIELGDPVRVREVHGNRIVVEAVEN